MTSRILKYLKFNACPTCGAGIRSEEYTGHTHCNGQQFENITFQCGCKIEWVPNFEWEVLATKCPKSIDAVAKTKRRVAIKTAILMAVKPGLTEHEQRAVDQFVDWGLPH
jgi:hypothetical protein